MQDFLLGEGGPNNEQLILVANSRVSRFSFLYFFFSFFFFFSFTLFFFFSFFFFLFCLSYFRFFSSPFALSILPSRAVCRNFAKASGGAKIMFKILFGNFKGTRLTQGGGGAGGRMPPPTLLLSLIFGFL